MKEHFLSLANYNAWANERLYEAVRHLPGEEIARVREGAFFTTILGTLSHLLIADRLWLDRVRGRPARHQRLDEVIAEDVESLWTARREEDREILHYCDGLSEAALLQDIAYTTVAGEQQVTRLDRILVHLFNHQTHHRGQAHALVLEAGAEPPPLDYIYYLRALG